MTTDPSSAGDSQQRGTLPPQAPVYGQQIPGQQAPGAEGTSAASKSEYFDFTDYRFRLPTAWPKSLTAATPSFHKGFGSVFQTAHMPMDARIGYWIWLVGCVFAIVAWFFSIAVIAFGVLINPFTLVATGMVGIFGGVRWGMVLLLVATMLFALVMLVLQLFMTLKVREGAEWARLGLTAITLASIVYSIILTAAGLESGGVGAVVTNFLSFVMVAFFWLPKANEWFLRTTDNGAPPAGTRRRAPRH